MTKNRYLLDCTLRDGGYINDWEFGHDNLVNVFERVVAAGVDVIEIGFLDERRNFDINRSIMPDTASAEKIYGKLKHAHTMVVGMIDYGTCDITHLQPCKESFLDGIRVIFKKEKLLPAMEFCRQVKTLGYKVFAQLVSVSSYSDEELKSAVAIANDVHPYALSMVDTYGLLNPTSLLHILKIIDSSLDSDICLGFHAHNNFQLGYINAMTVLESGISRDVLVDGSLYGMGKSAGNAPLELIAMSMNEKFDKSYQVSEMQEAIITSIIDFQKKSPWGYQLFYYIAASNRVHPNYVSYLMNKRTLSITEINEILQKIPEDQKLKKNGKLIEELYLNYQKKDCNDQETLQKLKTKLANQKLLVIGPGTSVKKCENLIQNYIHKEKPIVISINYIPDSFNVDYLFVTNNSRYLQMASKLLDEKYYNIPVIASSNITKYDGNFEYVVNYSNLIDEKAEFPDNSMCMLIKLLEKIDCKEITLAGLDGYTADNVNYFDADKEYSFLKEKAEVLNRYGRNFFRMHNERIQARFLTASLYEEKKNDY